jgi:type III secretion system YscD/HrpQ family protein
VASERPGASDMDTANGSGPTWQLRFQSGPLHGRVVALRAGDNLVGSAGECAVMLPGGDAQPRHLIVHVGELVVAVQRLDDAAVQLNGEPMQHARRSAMPGDVLCVGSVELQLERAVPVVETRDPMFDPDGSMPRAAAPSIDPARRQLGFKLGAGLLVAAIVGLVLLPLAAPGALRSGQTTQDGIDWVKRVTIDYPEVEVVANGAGQVSVRGFVESTLRKQALARTLEPIAGRATVSVRSADDVVDQATRYLAEPGVAVSYQGKGRLLVTGTARDEAVRERIGHLSAELHPDVLVVSQVRVRDNVEAPKPRAASDWRDHLPAKLVSITSGRGGMRYIQLANGARYYEGAVLKSGAEIKRIEADGTVVVTEPPVAEVVSGSRP